MYNCPYTTIHEWQCNGPHMQTIALDGTYHTIANYRVQRPTATFL